MAPVWKLLWNRLSGSCFPITVVTCLKCLYMTKQSLRNVAVHIVDAAWKISLWTVSCDDASWRAVQTWTTSIFTWEICLKIFPNEKQTRSEKRAKDFYQTILQHCYPFWSMHNDTVGIQKVRQKVILLVFTTCYHQFSTALCIMGTAAQSTYRLLLRNALGPIRVQTTINNLQTATSFG